NIGQDLKGIVSVNASDNKTNTCIIGVTSWNRPFSLYEYNTGTNQYQKSIFDNSVGFPGIEDVAVKEVEVPSHDGTMIPLSILYNKNIKLDGNNSCILT